MKRPTGRLAIMLLYLLTVPVLTDLQSVFDHAKAGVVYAKDGGGGGGGGNGGGGDGSGSGGGSGSSGKGDGGGGRDSSAGGRGDGDGARGSDSAGYEGGHRGRGESQANSRGGGRGHDHAGRGMGDPAAGSGQARSSDRDHRGQPGFEAGVRDREASVRALAVEGRRREAEAEDRDLGIIAAATPR